MGYRFGVCRQIGLMAGVLAATLFQPLQAAEFCSSEPASGTDGDQACHAALADGFGGLVTWERQRHPGEPLVIMAQWVNADFAPEGPEIVVSEHEEFPMWRPHVVLLNPDEAFVVWADGRNLPPGSSQTDWWKGFHIRGAVLERNAQESPFSFPLVEVTPETSAIEPVIAFNPTAQLAVVGWPDIRESEFEIYTYKPETLRASAYSGDIPTPQLLINKPNIYLGEIALDAETVARVNTNGPHIDFFNLQNGDHIADNSMAFLDILKDPLSELSEEETDYFLDYGATAYDIEGNLAVVTAIGHRDADNPTGFRVIGYAARYRSSNGPLGPVNYWIGNTSDKTNICRPEVAFSGSDPVVFLPIVDAETNKATLFVGNIATEPSAEPVQITREDGDLYPLPDELEQFSVILVDEGATGKAALVATSGRTPSHLCMWPSELIGF